MRLDYHAETDSLELDLAERPSVDSHLVAPGVALTFDRSGKVVGIRIDQASKTVNWKRLELRDLPLDEPVEVVATCRDADEGRAVEPPHPSDQIDDYTGAAQQEGAD